jgi:uncharacterized protein YndB with AHSA1/START domain
MADAPAVRSTARGEAAIDPARDLLLERDVPVSAEALWRGWTEPSLLKQWFCPLPWRVTEAEIDLRLLISTES